MTVYGVGNGVSLIIFGGIVARLPSQTTQTLRLLNVGEVQWWQFLLDVGVVLLSIVAVVLVTQAVRKIPVQYAKRVVGRRVYGGAGSDPPPRRVPAGAVPPLFLGCGVPGSRTRSPIRALSHPLTLSPGGFAPL